MVDSFNSNVEGEGKSWMDWWYREVILFTVEAKDMRVSRERLPSLQNRFKASVDNFTRSSQDTK